MSAITSMQSILDTLKAALGPGETAEDSTLPKLTRQIDLIQSEIGALHEEMNRLHQRDETLNFYMSRVDEEMRLAARLQQDFLPKSLPQLGRVRFHTLYRPAGYVSGDLYDVTRLDEKHVGFYMADAVGHGMPAALLTMFIKHALTTKQITPAGYRLLSPGEVMANLNESLIEQNLSYATFATAVYGHVNVDTLQVQFSRAGHPMPLLIAADGSITDLAADGSLLGIFPKEPFQTSTVQLKPGDRLMVFTDGVEVAFGTGPNVDINQWRKEIEARRSLSSEQLLNELSEQIAGQTGSLRPKDDLTVVMLDVLN